MDSKHLGKPDPRLLKDMILLSGISKLSWLHTHFLRLSFNVMKILINDI